MPPEDLEARRWLRELFRTLGAKYPGLKTTEAQERLKPSCTSRRRRITIMAKLDKRLKYQNEDRKACDHLYAATARATREARALCQ